MTLLFYFARRYLFIFLALLGIFLLFYGLLDMVDVIRRLDDVQTSFLEILTLTALNIPNGIYRILPLIVMLATLTLFLGLARSSELVVTRSAGQSALRSLLAPVLVTLLIGVVAVVAINPIVAATSTRYETLLSQYRKGVVSVLSVSREGLWLRQGGESGQTVIRATRASSDGTELFDVTFLGFSTDGVPRFRIEAESAELTQGAWVTENAKEWRFDETNNPEKAATHHDSLRVPSDLTVEEIRDGFGAPSAIPIWELPSYIDRLERAGFSARRHNVWMHTELAKPFFLVAMVLLGAGFTMRHTRFGRTGVMVISALLLGFGLYFIRNLAMVLGENGQIPVVLAAWAPPIAGIFLAMGIVLNMEDG